MRRPFPSLRSPALIFPSPSYSKFRDVIDRLTGPASFIDYISAFTNTLWPGGFRRPPTVLRTEDEKRRTKEAVVEKLPHLIPGQSANAHI